MMDGHGKSDRSIVPAKSPNKARPKAAEAMEGREWTKGNLFEADTCRTQSRESVLSGTERVRQAAERNRRQRFTSLLHHVYDSERLRAAYLGVQRKAVPGVDGETWQHYGENLEANLQDLSERLKRGAYRARPVRRTYIPKADGRQRPLGVPTLEDKVVQRAVVEVLNAIYETDFLGFSYGFRPGRNPHHALDALAVGIEERKVNWVLDADLRGFFDTLDHRWLVRFVEHRVGDRRVVRLIQKWLKAGVLEEGRRMVAEVGTVQGGAISPLLANIYLHYVFDLWAQWWRRTRVRGDMIIVRYADDFVVGFQYRTEAVRFLGELIRRLARFKLELHPDKTRLIEFGRFARSDRERRGLGKPPTFDFLGFTHCCGRTRDGEFMVLRQTMRKRLRAKVKEVKEYLRRRLHRPLDEQGSYLRAVLLGHYRYYGVPRNGPALRAFRHALAMLWRRLLLRRGSRRGLTWKRYGRHVAKWFPSAHICHPYPNRRLAAMTQGGSRMR